MYRGRLFSRKTIISYPPADIIYQYIGTPPLSAWNIFKSFIVLSGKMASHWDFHLLVFDY